MEKAYEALNRLIAEWLKPHALWVREWIHARREKREDKREELITKILNFTIQGEAVVNVPNLLSVLRPIFVLIAVIMYVYGTPWYIVLLVVIIALVTDKFDGAWAEIDGKTAFGAFLDPTCDKISLIIMIAPFLPSLTSWVVYPMVAIELSLFLIAVVGLFIQGMKKREHTDFRSNIFGKMKFAIQSVGLCFLVLDMLFIADIAFAISIPFALLSIVIKAYTLSKT